MRGTISCAFVRPLTLMLLAAALTAGASRASAQSTGQLDSSLTQGNLEQTSGAATEPSGALAGGGAIQDFGTLMNLIQQTVDPDSWLANGGSSTMLPFPSGVYVDPNGKLNRITNDEVVLDVEGILQEQSSKRQYASKMRVISLRSLEDALSKAASLVSSKEGGRDDALLELRKLAGLAQIQYVKLDIEHEDVLLVGPAAGSAGGYQLEDLAIVIASAGALKVPMGCTIEPQSSGLQAAQAYINEPSTAKKLARSPEMVAEQIAAKMGTHSVRVFGINPATSTAIALVDADEHMKLVGFGKVKLPFRMDNYFDHLDRLSDVPSQSLIRWWFAYGDEPVKANSQGTVFELPKNCAAVLSEQQWVTKTGRAATGKVDEAADGFARNITQHMPQFRQHFPSYARLCAVFESSLAMQLVLETTGQPNLRVWFPNLCKLGACEQPGVEPATSVGGLTAWHKTKSGMVIAVVSGGVDVDPRRLAGREAWESSKFLSDSLIPDSPESEEVASSWWWD